MWLTEVPASNPNRRVIESDDEEDEAESEEDTVAPRKPVDVEEEGVEESSDKDTTLEDMEVDFIGMCGIPCRIADL